MPTNVAVRICSVSVSPTGPDTPEGGREVVAVGLDPLPRAWRRVQPPQMPVERKWMGRGRGPEMQSEATEPAPKR